MMKKVFVFILLMFLSGCYTPEDHYSVHIGNRNTALVKTPSNGWGIGTGLKTIEHAVYSAFKTCEDYNPNQYCALKQINGRSVSISEAQEWKDRYSKNAQFVTFSKRDGGWYVSSDSGQRYKEPKKVVKEKEPKKQKPKAIAGDNEVVPAASGSGFYITSSGYILTNNHVIEGCRKVSLTHDGKEFEANIIATDSKNDLAILKSNVRPKRFYKIRKDDPKLLENVIIAGYPLGKRVSAAIKTSKGSVTSLAGYGDNYSNFQTDAALNQGNSGGPIMDESGNIVGVAVANFGKQAGVESFNFGIKSSTVKSFVSSNDINFTIGPNANLNNEQLSNLITNATIYLECWLTVADIKKIIAQEENKKAFYSKYQ